MYTAAIFDLDGTIAYTLPDLAEGLTRAHAKFGLPPVTEEMVLTFVNGTAAEFVRNCFPAGMSEEYYKEALETYISEYSHCYLHHTRVYEGISETLSELKEHGIKLAVLTNKDDTSAKRLVQKLCGDVFDIIIGAGIFPGKPDPTSALYIAEQFGCKPENIAYFGDSDVDMMTAVNAKMMPCGVTWGYRSADILLKTGAKLLIDRPAQIRELIITKGDKI